MQTYTALLVAPRQKNPLFDRPVKSIGVSVPGGTCPEPRIPTHVNAGQLLTPAQQDQVNRIKNAQSPKVGPERQ